MCLTQSTTRREALMSTSSARVEENCWIRLKISAAGLRMINKVGLDAAIRQAVDKGFLNWNELEKNVIAWGNVEN